MHILEDFLFEVIILTNAKIYQFLHSSYCIESNMNCVERKFNCM